MAGTGQAGADGESDVKQVPLLSRPLEIGAISDAGREEHVVATEAERAAIAAEHKLISVDRLEADLDIRRSGAELVVIDGRLRAKVVHTCVVSLDPAPQTIDETFHISFVMAGSRQAPAEPKPGAEVLVDPESDQPDVIPGSSIDLGAVVLEHFSLALDPYPRAPGAALPPEAPDGDAGPESPFAALAALKARKG